MTSPNYPKVAQLKDLLAFRGRLTELGIPLPADDRVLSAAEGSPMAEPMKIGDFEVGNRWCIHPMEGWDANRDGSPSEHTLRRWRNFGLSGAKLIWGGKAAAILYSMMASQGESGRAVCLRAGSLNPVIGELAAYGCDATSRCLVGSAPGIAPVLVAVTGRPDTSTGK